jgi:hypothetical protein
VILLRELEAFSQSSNDNPNGVLHCQQNRNGEMIIFLDYRTTSTSDIINHQSSVLSVLSVLSSSSSSSFHSAAANNNRSRPNRSRQRNNNNGTSLVIHPRSVVKVSYNNINNKTSPPPCYRFLPF